jgi:hypothetical protein
MGKPLFFILIAVVILIVSITMYQMRYNEASSLVVPDFLVMAQITDPEETQIIIDNAEVRFVVCDSKPTGEHSTIKYYNELECDHNILFLKGLCENSNNTAYNWCYNADMERYLNDRGLKDAPRPPDAWCNMFIDSCISKWEAMKQSTIDLDEKWGEVDSSKKLINTYDDIIQALEDKKEAAQGDDDE